MVGHQVPQGSFVGQAEAVREHDGRVYDCTVDQLREGERDRDRMHYYIIIQYKDFKI